MAGKSVFLSLTRQVIFMIPLLLILPPLMGLDGVWSAYPISDLVATVVSVIMLIFQMKKIKARAKENAVSTDAQIRREI